MAKTILAFAFAFLFSVNSIAQSENASINGKQNGPSDNALESSDVNADFREIDKPKEEQEDPKIVKQIVSSTLIGAGVGAVLASVVLYVFQMSERNALQSHLTKTAQNTYVSDITREEMSERENLINMEFFSAIGFALFGLIATPSGIAMKIFWE